MMLGIAMDKKYSQKSQKSLYQFNIFCVEKKAMGAREKNKSNKYFSPDG